MIGLVWTGQAPGAWPKGTRVQKRGSKRGEDTHRDGALATVLSSIEAPPLGYGYWVEWDDTPNIAVFVAGHRLALA